MGQVKFKFFMKWPSLGKDKAFFYWHRPGLGWVKGHVFFFQGVSIWRWKTGDSPNSLQLLGCQWDIVAVMRMASTQTQILVKHGSPRINWRCELCSYMFGSWDRWYLGSKSHCFLTYRLSLDLLFGPHAHRMCWAGLSLWSAGLVWEVAILRGGLK